VIMSGRTDVRLAEARICEIVGTSQQQRRQLVSRDLLRAAPAAGCTLRDAFELAALVELQDQLETRAARVAWSQLRAQLAELVPGTRLEVVFDLRLGSIRLARSDTELAQAVRVRRPIQVIELGTRLQEVGDAFRRWADVAPFRPPQRGRRRDQRSA
jgi:hypothetical protein